MYGNQFNKPSFLNPTQNTTFGNGNVTGNPFGKIQFFGKPSGFGQSTTSFGQPVNNTSVFSSMPSSNFFQTPSTTSSFNAGSAQTGFGTNLFAPQQQQQSAGTNLFGTPNAFGQNKPAGFAGFGGAQNQPSIFSSPVAQQQPAGASLFPSNTNTLFGGTSAFGAQAQTGTVIKFNPVTGSDTMQKNGVTQSISTKHHCITCMKEYENKSLEELRYEDYMANRKGPQQQAGFGSPGFGNPTATQAPSLFGQTDNKTNFGQTPAFGQSTPFGQNTSSFGLTNQQTTSLFGKPTPFATPSSNTTGFGGFTGSAPTVANPFNANQAQKPFASQAMFGPTTTQAAPTFGTGVFGQTGNQPASSNLFQKQAPGLGQPGFSFNLAGANQATMNQSSMFSAAKPAFNITTPSFGQVGQPVFGNTALGKPTTTGFSQAQQPLFNTTLGGMQQQNQSIFGNTAAKPPTFGTTGTTSNFFQNASFQPSANLSNFQPATQTQHDPSLDVTNISLIAIDIFPSGPYAKLEPIPSNKQTSTTNQQEIKAILDISKRHEDVTNPRSKISVTSTSSPRHNTVKDLFETSQPLKMSCKRLVIKKAQDAEPLFNRHNDGLLEAAERVTKSQANIPNSEENQTNQPDVFSTSSDSSLMTNLPARLREKKGVRLNFDSNESGLGDNVSGIGIGKDDEENISVALSPRDIEKSSSSSSFNNNANNPAGVILTRPDYYMIPPVEELGNYMNDKGECLVRGLTIGRKGYGNVYYWEVINVRNLNLDEIIFFRHKEIVVYPNEDGKAERGEGLNRPAQVTLDKVYPRVQGTKEYLTDPDEIIASGFQENLMAVTQRHGCKFVEYRPETGSWVFKVNHFSRYGLTESDEEQCEVSVDKNLVGKEAKAVNKGREERKFIEGENGESEAGDKSDLLLSASAENENVSVHSQTTSMGKSDVLSMALAANMSDEDVMEVESDLQVAKASLFQDFLRADEIESPLVAPEIEGTFSDDDDADSNLPDSTTNESPEELPFIVLLKPVRYQLEILSESEIPKLSYFGQRCHMDLTMFKGGAFKPTWSKDRISNTGRYYNGKFTYHLEELQIDYNVNDFSKMIPDLEGILNITLNESSFIYNGEIPTLKIKFNHDYLEQINKVFEEHATANSTDKYLAHVLSLCAALWGKVEKDSTSARRDALSNWLKTSLYKEFEKKSSMNAEELVDHIFELLTHFKTREASVCAIENRLYHMSLLISQLSASEVFKEMMRKYVATFEMSPEVPNIFKKIYVLIAGTLECGLINVSEGLDWMRALGLFLWYLSPTGCPIDRVLHDYSKAFIADKVAKPRPIYSSDDKCFDLIYEILRMYTRRIYDLANVLTPSTHTDDVADYRVSWILLQLFRSLKVGWMDPYKEGYIHLTFSSQLEQMGYWKWAIFVLLYIENDSLKKNLIMKILERNLDDDEDSADIEDELVRKMKIPIVWLYEVKASKALLEGKFYHAYQYFVKSKDWTKSNEILLTQIVPELFLNEQHGDLVELIDWMKANALSLPNYQNEIGLFIDYFELKNWLEGVVEPGRSDEILTRIWSIINRLKKFPMHSNEQKLCMVELSRRCTFVLSKFLNTLGRSLNSAEFQELMDHLVMPTYFTQSELLHLVDDQTMMP